MEIDPHAAPLSVTARPELTGGRRIGVLLSHGFTGSPASMRPWGEHLGALGYGVEVPRLPGHGTTWRDLNEHRFGDWYAEVAATFDRMRADHDQVVLGGLSMGGTLVLRLAADHPGDVAGVMLVNPAAASKRLDLKALPVLKHLIAGFPAIGNDIKREGVDEHGYGRTPLKAVHSLVQAWPHLQRDLAAVTSPLIYFRSTVDHVVDDASEPVILDGISSTDVTRVRLPDSYHVATLDNDADLIFDKSVEFITRVTS
ncbi:alpha/beta fold hydrolase [Nocardioides panacisoli]|uniref:alpha/beta hydrolase n=1 Tax=Nocardioides panacisoli TaxID=627624 RepID=UPI001C634028|nr:alpha/beta fold hydrolase [Nocardioides panacisoli]QYJ04669.1 alpha/beta fold hydrolase [Nocardioides panacisoli]